ncbi:MAG TPA: subclass B3 metallo-beta-lactamase [Terriglobia bacterium]|nr:subclass B3 metallo-beta-lactamase [Terriglobia bacterium]
MKHAAQQFAGILAAMLGSLLLLGALPMTSAAANGPQKPFRVIGNVYYVGDSDVTSFLIITPQGDFLIDGGYIATAPRIEQNIRKLGFRLKEVKILLNTHAHLDHAGGLAQLKRDTGAKFEAMAGDAPILAHGGRGYFYFNNAFPAIKPDRILHDGDVVALGGEKLRAVLTAGHTRGCTTWTWTVRDRGKDYHVVDVCSTTVLPGYRLVKNPTYPGIAQDYIHTFQRLKSLPCDVFLGAHGSFFLMQEKLARLRQQARQGQNPFIDPEGYRRYVDASEAQFEEKLKSEQGSRR